MNYTLKVYVDSLFKDVPESPAVNDLRDEILSNLEERYDDCIKSGMSHQRAYAAVIGTMGDVSRLIAQVSDTGVHTAGIFEKASSGGGFLKKYGYIFTEENIKTIKRASIAIMWLLIVLLFFLLVFNGGEEYSWLMFIVGAGLTVGVNTAAKALSMSRRGDGGETRAALLKTVQRGVSAIIWLMAVFFFFVTGFDSYQWELSWLLFIVAAIVQIIINTVFKIQIRKYR
ncbi:MAG: permease prefix domain 1-containing protein [Ruminococcus sp.]|nr:permease prefix domain 1-containing protein [Ruminococcus sp.]